MKSFRCVRVETRANAVNSLRTISSLPIAVPKIARVVSSAHTSSARSRRLSHRCLPTCLSWATICRHPDSLTRSSRSRDSFHCQVSNHCRTFASTTSRPSLKTHILSDVGEGIKEVQIIQWFVEEGARIEEWEPLCEVQSDKASVEISSRYTGVIKKLNYERDAVVQVGDELLEIEVEGEEDADEDEEANVGKQEKDKGDEVGDSRGGKEEAERQGKGTVAESTEVTEPPDPEEANQETTPPTKNEGGKEREVAGDDARTRSQEESLAQKAGMPPRKDTSNKNANLATPAVRGLLKEHRLDIAEIDGTGRDGRVLKEDIFNYLENRKSGAAQRQMESPQEQTRQPAKQAQQTRQITSPDVKQTETQQNLTPIQSAMFKTMTKSLQIPHFLYSDTYNVTQLVKTRTSLNSHLASIADKNEQALKLSYMPFILKAVSIALHQYPLLNAKLDTSEASKPKLLLRSSHNISVAIDSPSGLLVPVIKNVQARSLNNIAAELSRLSSLATQGKLSNEDLTGGTITVSNIGSIGGETVSPVIVDGQLAICGVGKIKTMPIYDDGGELVKAQMMSVSWSADHRVIDGASMAKMASLVGRYLEAPERMLGEMI